MRNIRITSLLLIATLTLGIAGCSEGNTIEPTIEQSSESTNSTELTTVDKTEVDNETEETKSNEAGKLTYDQAKSVIQEFFWLQASFEAGMLFEKLKLKEHNDSQYGKEMGQGGVDYFPRRYWVEYAQGQYNLEFIEERWGVMYLYDDYENAMLQYVTKDILKNYFMFSIHIREDGFLDGVGGGTPAFGRVDDLIFIGEDNGIYKYEIKLGYLNEHFPNVYLYTRYIELVFDGENYIVCGIDNMDETKTPDEERISVFFPGYIINENEHTIYGFEKEMDIKSFDLTKMYGEGKVFPDEFFRIEFLKEGKVVTEGTIEENMILKIYFDNSRFINEYKVVMDK